jgi:hypothetical protein
LESTLRKNLSTLDFEGTDEGANLCRAEAAIGSAAKNEVHAKGKAPRFRGFSEGKGACAPRRTCPVYVSGLSTLLTQ